MNTNPNTTRDPIDVVLLWTAGIGAAAALALSSTFAPLFYLWAMRLLTIVGIIAACVAIGSTFSDDDNDARDDYFALQAVFGGMRLLGVLLAALCGISTSSD